MDDELEWIKALNKELSSAHMDAVKQRERMRKALREYHNLIPAVAECVSDCGEALLYSELHVANQKAEAILKEGQ